MQLGRRWRIHGHTDRRGEGAIGAAELQAGIAPPDWDRQGIEHGAKPQPLALRRIAWRAIGEPDGITAIARESLAADIHCRTIFGEAQPQREAGAIGAKPRHGAIERGEIIRLKAVEQIGEAARRGAERAQRAGKEAIAGRAKQIERGWAAPERRAELIEAGSQALALRGERGNAQRLAVDDEAGQGRNRQHKPQE